MTSNASVRTETVFSCHRCFLAKEFVVVTLVVNEVQACVSLAQSVNRRLWLGSDVAQPRLSFASSFLPFGLILGAGRKARGMTTDERMVQEDWAKIFEQNGLSPEKFTVTTKSGRKLACCANIVAPRSSDWMVLCHGLFSHKNQRLLQALSTRSPMNSVRFDFHCNGESEGEPLEWTMTFQRDCDDDLESVVSFLRALGGDVKLLVGHSRGANVVLMHAFTYDTVPYIVSLAARHDSNTGLEKYFHPGDLDKLLAGEIEEVTCAIKPPDNVPRKIRRKCLLDRISIDMSHLSKVQKAKKIWFVHGDADAVIPHDHASDLATHVRVPNQIHIVPETGHSMSSRSGSETGLELIHEIFERHVYPVVLEEGRRWSVAA